MATFTVTNTNDSGAGSLRQAIADANASVGVADTIQFAAGLAGDTIVLATGELALTGDVTIDGDVNGDDKADIIISGNNASRIFNISGAGTDADLRSLTLTNGNGSYGGAIRSNAGTTLDIFDTTIRNNMTAGSGGGIYSVGALTVTDSTISSNSAAGYGGGVILSPGASATFINATIDGNTATGGGGGISTAGSNAINVFNSTITGNNAGQNGGGIELFNGSNAFVVNSIVALNTAANGATIAESGTPSTLVAGNSFFGTTVAIDTNSGGNLNNAGDPLLGALQDNGGTVQTRNLLANSAAINAGNNAASGILATDANGNDRTVAGTVDMGATEFQLVVTTAADVVNANDGVLSLREAIALANANADADTITFAANLAGQSVTLTGGELDLTNDVTIDGDVNGDDKADITISGNNASRIFDVSGAGTDAGLRSLTLANGNGSGGNGGAIYSAAGTTLDILDTTVRNSTADFGAGIASSGTLTVTDSTISSNGGALGGGVSLGSGASASFVNATIDGNTATNGGGGIQALGSNTINILNSTITGNSAVSDGGGINLFGFSGGSTVTVVNSIVALNTAGSGATIAETGGASTLVAGNSFFGTTVAIDTDNGGNLNTAGDPLLGALQDNGGTVQTRNLLADSAAINAGNNAAPGLPATDANGSDRTVASTVDMGATEFRLVVTTAADVVDANDGALSLREAVALANAGADADSITFAASLAGQTVTLTGGELALTGDVSIDGDVNGDNKADIIISGNNASRIFSISGAGTDADLASLTLTNGNAIGGSGGAINAAAGTTLDIFDTTIRNSVVAGSGGGIFSGGALTVTGSTISSNSAGFGGGVMLGYSASATFVNATIDGNTATNSGGGIDMFGSNPVKVYNSTITGNNAGSSGGGINLYSGSNAFVVNSIVALNTAASGATIAETGYFASTLTAQHSFFGTTVAIDLSLGGNINNGGDPLLGSLQDNGGTVQTRDLLANSAAIDAGYIAAYPLPFSATDANGNDRTVGANVDMGATEFQLKVTTATDDAFGGGSLAAEAADGGGLSLREALAFANANADADLITFAANLAGSTLTLTGELEIFQSVTIDGDVNGDDKADITISGANAYRIFSISGGDTDLLSLTLVNGRASGALPLASITGDDGGAIAIWAGTLDIVDSTISGSTAVGRGGAIASEAATVRLANSLLNGNIATASGGGIFTIAATLGITNSTLHGNSTNGYGGGIDATVGSAVTILSSTITGNRADTDGALTNAGGAIFNSASTFTINNSIVGENTSGTGNIANDVAGATIGAANANVFSTNPFFLTGSGNSTNTANLLLGQLLDNGGTVLTRSPLDGSVAIGAGNNGLLPLDVHDIDGDGNVTEVLPLDGRGDIRLRDVSTDAGAVEQKVDETIGGTAGADMILGGLGNDILRGRGGSDTLDGGAGTNDTADYSEATGTGVTVNLTLAGAQLISATQGSDTLINIENITGSSLNDTLTGNGSANIINGGLGNDTMAGGGGADTYFDNLGDTVTEALGAGSDTVNTIRNTYTLPANVERVNFIGSGNFVGTGSSINNRFQGGLGDDRFVDVLGGADIFSGNAGTDTVDFRSSATGAVINMATLVHGGAAAGDSYSGIEKFLGSNTAIDTMTGGGTGRWVFVGGGGNDNLTGGIKNDQLIGQGGNDTLIGGNDRDSLDGGTGNDTMTGGTQGDVFVYIDAAFGQDTITDYQDGIDSFKVFSAVADNIADFTIAGNGTTSVTLTLGANTITINGAAPITIAADDFVFY